ncbi:transposase [Klebsiella quasipneumoniae]|uniref:transposase n=1 Tax=Klebsiella quasipneumoniae TaxID=1463165 RepID=UPI0015DC859B|nr:transposase [Klebsiella quasipneumoniae]BBQ90047.1 hypothetical protein WP3W18E06_31750 [Raoultella ornithinolytica]BBQ92385.1 hypothetical protein WP3W18E06_P12430 [Raoultella ornithinolytica]BBW16690.1 hypothetical protein STN0717CIT36_21140 [Citrobacter portucalensis]
MKTSKFSDSQILAILKQAEAGAPVPELCREHGMSSATFYKWRAKFGGMDASMMARLKELEAENARLKKMYAEERLKAEILKEAIEKSGKAVAPTGVGAKGGAKPFHYHQVCMWSIWAERNLLPLSGQTQ